MKIIDKDKVIKILIISCVVCMVIVAVAFICACFDPTSGNEMLENAVEAAMNDTQTFVTVEILADAKIVYHRDTKVMFVVSNGFYNRGTFTLLVNPDGSPMLYQQDENDSSKEQ